MAHQPSPDTQTAPRRDRTHFLYMAVIVAVLLGVLVGFVAPDFAVKLAPLGEGFVNLIKMMIVPVIFCTLVLGVGSVRSAASVGKVGGLALTYFLVMSTFALAIGLVVGNLLHPGSGLHITEDLAAAGQEQAAEAGSTTEFLLEHHPDHAVLRAHGRRGAADPAWWRCSSVSRCRPWDAPASRSCAAWATCSGWCSGCSR